MNGRSVLALVALAVAGCAASPAPASKIGYYDLGPAGAGPNNRVVAALRGIEVSAPSWLDTPALPYVLAYKGGQQRQTYAESRWVAPPAELMGQSLRKRMLSGETAGACVLRVDLEEFAQVFDGPESSRGIMEARVQLLAPGSELVARRAFRVSRPASSPDAKGGVAALAAAVEDFAAALRAWLGGLDQETKPGLNRIDRCRPA